MTTFVTVPVIRTDSDLANALARIDQIIDAPDGSPEAEERSVLSTLISDYEDRHHIVMEDLIDWNAVAEFTGCEKMYGAQGRAPSIAEMIQCLQDNIYKDIAGSEHADLVESGTLPNIESVIGTLILRSKVTPGC